MIVVRVEMWPGGLERRKRTLVTGIIVNDGTGNPNTGNYHVALGRKGGTRQNPWTLHPLLNRKAWRRGRVRGHKRQREHVWRLVYKALAAAIEDE